MNKTLTKPTTKQRVAFETPIEEVASTPVGGQAVGALALMGLLGAATAWLLNDTSKSEEVKTEPEKKITFEFIKTIKVNDILHNFNVQSEASEDYQSYQLSSISHEDGSEYKWGTIYITHWNDCNSDIAFGLPDDTQDQLADKIISDVVFNEQHICDELGSQIEAHHLKLYKNTTFQNRHDLTHALAKKIIADRTAWLEANPEPTEEEEEEEENAWNANFPHDDYDTYLNNHANLIEIDEGNRAYAVDKLDNVYRITTCCAETGIVSNLCDIWVEKLEHTYQVKTRKSSSHAWTERGHFLQLLNALGAASHTINEAINYLQPELDEDDRIDYTSALISMIDQALQESTKAKKGFLVDIVDKLTAPTEVAKPPDYWKVGHHYGPDYVTLTCDMSDKNETWHFTFRRNEKGELHTGLRTSPAELAKFLRINTTAGQAWIDFSEYYAEKIWKEAERLLPNIKVTATPDKIGITSCIPINIRPYVKNSNKFIGETSGFEVNSLETLKSYLLTVRNTSRPTLAKHPEYCWYLIQEEFKKLNK